MDTCCVIGSNTRTKASAAKHPEEEEEDEDDDDEEGFVDVEPRGVVEEGEETCQDQERDVPLAGTC